MMNDVSFQNDFVDEKDGESSDLNMSELKEEISDDGIVNEENNNDLNSSLSKFLNYFLSDASNKKSDEISDVKNDEVLYLSSTDLGDIYNTLLVHASGDKTVPSDLLQKYNIDNPKNKFINIKNEQVPVDKFIAGMSSFVKESSTSQNSSLEPKTTSNNLQNVSEEQSVTDADLPITSNESAEDKFIETESTLMNKEEVLVQKNNPTSQAIVKTAVDNRNNKLLSQVDRKIENGILYLQPDDLIDIYKHSVTGVDNDVYILNSFIHRYHIDDPSVHTIDIKGDQFPAEKILSLKVSDNRKLRMKEIYDKIRTKNATTLNSTTPSLSNPKSSDEIQKENSTKEIASKEVDAIAKDIPVKQIDDSDGALENDFRKDEIVEEPVPTQEVSAEVSDSHDLKKQEEPEKSAVEPVTKEEPSTDNEESANSKYKDEEEYKLSRVNEIAQNTYFAKPEETEVADYKLANNAEMQDNSGEFIYVSSPLEVQVDKRLKAAAEIPETNDSEYTQNLYDAIKQEQINNEYDAIKSDSGKIITISDPGMKEELNQYLVDSRRKIYIIEESKALKTFGIINDGKVDQKVLLDGDVLKVYSGEDNLLLSAPYGTLEDNYLDDNVFILPNMFAVAVDRDIEHTMIDMENFQVEVAHVAFRLPKNKEMINVRNDDASKYVENLKEYLVEDIDNQLDTSHTRSDIFLSATLAREIGLVLDDKGINDNIEKLIISKRGVNERVNIVKLINIFCKEFADPFRNQNRRIIRFYKMIRQLLMDATYYAESKLLVFNYAEVLVFLTDYFDINLANVYTIQPGTENQLFLDALKYSIDNNLNYVDESKKINGMSYFIPSNFIYVVYDEHILNIRADYKINLSEVDERLLHRPSFSDTELFNMSAENYDRLHVISPFIDLVSYYDGKKNEILNSKGLVLGSVSKKEIESVLDEQNKVGQDFPEVNDKNSDILYLTQNQASDLYKHSRVSDNGIVYIDEAEWNKLTLGKNNIKAVEVNGEVIPISTITKKEMDDELEGKDFVRAAEKPSKKIEKKKSTSNTNVEVLVPAKQETNANDELTPKPKQETDVLEKQTPSSVKKQPDEAKVQQQDVQKQSEIATADLAPTKQEVQPVVDSAKEETTDNKSSIKTNQESASTTANITQTKDGKIINLTLQQINDIVAESKVTEDKTAYLSTKLAQKYGLTAPDVIGINVEGNFIPLERHTKQDLKKEKQNKK